MTLLAERGRRSRRSFTDQAGLLAVLDCLPVNVFVCDLQLRLVYMSPTAVRTMDALRAVVRAEFGVDVDDLIGQSIHRFHADPAHVERVLAVPENFPHRSDFPLAGMRLQSTVSAITDAAGRVSGYVAVVDDITEKYRLHEQVTRAASEFTGSSRELAALAEELDQAASRVSGQAVAMTASTEQLSASIRTVSAGAADVDAVVTSTQAATASVAKLGESSARIGDITGLINAITEQTKLLALNATIEASRAGAAGSGFAVVAHEVKELAQRTREATGQIAQMIADIQADTTEARTAIDAIGAGIERVGNRQLEINAVTEEQSRSVREIASVVEEVADSIGGVASATAAIRGAAATLSVDAAGLDDLVVAEA